MLGEPHSLDPQTTASNGGNYVFQNIFRGLFRYHSQRGLVYEGAKRCSREKLQLTCTLNSAHRWSNGEKIVAEDYVRAFRRLADPERRSPQTELLLSLKNAKKILAGELSPDRLGVKALKTDVLRFEFAVEDPEFEYRLIHVATSPLPKAGFVSRENAADLVTSGPYKIKEWKLGQRIDLVANAAYGLPANSARPDLQALFIEDDATALRLYESGRLNFLRRLSFAEIPRYQTHPEYHQLPILRFDYVGFGGPLLEREKLRQALATSIDFSTYKNLVDHKGVPGCPSLPARMMDRPSCLEFNALSAKASLVEAGQVPKVELYFSRMGGDDVAQIAQWLQGQWKKNLSLQVELKGEEQVVYLRRLSTQPPAIFKKGVSLDRPTCLAAVENFTRGNRENYLRVDDDQFEALVKNLSLSPTEVKKKIACRKAVDHLLKSYRLIPLGESYFSLLAKVRFQGWNLNELNQLDLTDLDDLESH